VPTAQSEHHDTPNSADACWYVGGDIHKTGIKWYGSNIANPEERGLPRSIHTITLNDPLSGTPEFLIDGQVASAMRTGAVAGVGAARIQGDRATTATVVAPGVIGQRSALALDSALDSLETLRLHHPEQWKADAFEAEMADDLDAEIEPVSSAADAVTDSDVTVVAATGSPPPKIEGSWLKEDCPVIPLGDLRTSLSAFDEDRVFCDIRRHTPEFAAHMDWQVMNALAAAVNDGVALESGSRTSGPSTKSSAARTRRRPRAGRSSTRRGCRWRT